MSEPPLYDVENALREVDRRLRQRCVDPLTDETARIAEKLAVNLRRHFSTPGEQEIAGKAVLLVAASLGALSDPNLPLAVVLNVGAFAGNSLVKEARRG